jgi:hypothetical protein
METESAVLIHDGLRPDSCLTKFVYTLGSRGDGIPVLKYKGLRPDLFTQKGLVTKHIFISAHHSMADVNVRARLKVGQDGFQCPLYN